MHKLENIRAVFFDAGNTLIYPDYFRIQKLVAEFGVNAKISTIKAMEFEAKAVTYDVNSPFPWKQFFGIWLKGLGVQKAELSTVSSKLWQSHRHKNLWTLLDPDAIKTLSELRYRGIDLGVISNSRGTMKSLLEEVGVASYLDIIVDSQLFGACKPDPAIYEFALKELNVVPDQALFVGDVYEIDVVGAERAGMQAILLDPTDRCDQHTCLKIKRLEQVLEVLEKPGIKEN